MSKFKIIVVMAGAALLGFWAMHNPADWFYILGWVVCGAVWLLPDRDKDQDKL